MGDRYFDMRNSSTGYFTDSRTTTPRQDSRASAPKADPKSSFVQGTSVSGDSPYSTSTARVVVKKYSLKR
jgi:hypothetical protein